MLSRDNYEPFYQPDAAPYTTKYLLISGVADAMLSAYQNQGQCGQVAI
jgi:hypothetical protein